MNSELKNEINSLLLKNSRLDGRKPLETRPIFIEFNVTRNAEGSARVKIGETEVIAGTKLEIMEPYPDTPAEGSLMVNCELYPMSNPEFESGPPDIHAIELARVTDRGIRESGCIDVKKLCVKEGEKVWMVVIDVCPINDAGNLFDAIPLAAMGALLDTKFPGFDGEKIDYKEKTKKLLPILKKPITVTVFKYGNNFLVDPTNDEEKVYDSRLTITVEENGSICSFQKGGEKAFSVEDISKMVDIAVEKSKEYRKILSGGKA